MISLWFGLLKLLKRVFYIPKYTPLEEYLMSENTRLLELIRPRTQPNQNSNNKQFNPIKTAYKPWHTRRKELENNSKQRVPNKTKEYWDDKIAKMEGQEDDGNTKRKSEETKEG